VKKAKSDYLIQSVSRALDILEAFAVGQEDLGVTELSRKLKLHKNNVFRLLATLETRGYVEQDRETGNYRLGMKTFEVASVFLLHLGLIEQARGTVEQLAAETGETAYLAVLDGPSVVCVDSVETAQAVRVVSFLGRRLPAHATALGKALLAWRPQEELEQLWKQHEPTAVTPRTLTDPTRLGEELSRVVAQEVALEDEEATPGVRAVAAPVRDYQRRVVGAVGVVGPVSRLTLERLSGEIAPRVKAAAQAASRRLGYAVVPG
jgi:IclR family transcriptional regulator, KDG regulon repressor